MKERPIIFSGDSVRAIVDGRKTQTRRVIRKARGAKSIYCGERDGLWVVERFGDPGQTIIKCPYGVPGDRLWVREKLTRPDGDPWLYAADRQPVTVAREDETEMLVWAHHKDQDFCASIHMPRWASRITLEVADVRIQRVQDITEADAEAEGVTGDDALIGQISNPFRTAFADIWDSINLRRGYGWDANPWVVAVTFRWLA